MLELLTFLCEYPERLSSLNEKTLSYVQAEPCISIYWLIS